MALLTAVAGVVACGGRGAPPVRTLHGDVVTGTRLALFDTVRDAPYLFDVVALCTDGGAPTTITDVRVKPSIIGALHVTGWGVQDSDTVHAGDPPSPGGVAGTFATYPKYSHAQVRNPCSDADRVTDLVMQVERTSTGTAGTQGVIIDYRTARGRGQLRTTLQYALCTSPNREAICHELVRG